MYRAYPFFASTTTVYQDYYVATGQTSSPSPSTTTPQTMIAQGGARYKDYYAATAPSTVPAAPAASTVARSTGRYRDYYASRAPVQPSPVQSAGRVVQTSASEPREAVAVNLPK